MCNLCNWTLRGEGSNCDAKHTIYDEIRTSNINIQQSDYLQLSLTGGALAYARWAAWRIRRASIARRDVSNPTLAEVVAFMACFYEFIQLFLATPVNVPRRSHFSGFSSLCQTLRMVSCAQFYTDYCLGESEVVIVKRNRQIARHDHTEVPRACIF